jgi:hypothetical protein
MLLCFAGWLSECTLHKQYSVVQCGVFSPQSTCILLLCGVQFTYTLQLAAWQSTCKAQNYWSNFAHGNQLAKPVSRCDHNNGWLGELDVLLGHFPGWMEIAINWKRRCIKQCPCTIDRLKRCCYYFNKLSAILPPIQIKKGSGVKGQLLHESCPLTFLLRA